MVGGPPTCRRGVTLVHRLLFSLVYERSGMGSIVYAPLISVGLTRIGNDALYSFVRQDVGLLMVIGMLARSLTDLGVEVGCTFGVVGCCPLDPSKHSYRQEQDRQ